MKIDQLNPCPFCGQKPVRHDSVEPAGFVGSSEENQLFLVACMTDDCQPSGVYLPDNLWNLNSATQGALMKAVLETLEAEKSPLFDKKKKLYRLYVMSH